SFLQCSVYLPASVLNSPPPPLALPSSPTRRFSDLVPAAAASEAALGRVGISLVSIGMMISMLATLNGTVMSGGRVPFAVARDGRSEEHTSELQSLTNLVCRLLLEKKNNTAARALRN